MAGLRGRVSALAGLGAVLALSTFPRSAQAAPSEAPRPAGAEEGSAGTKEVEAAFQRQDAALPDVDEVPDFLAPAVEEDPCAPIREALAAYQSYLERIAAERTSFAYVEDAADATALRLLQAMRRCAEYPEDPDCKAPPMEVELRDLEPPRHTYESWPSDLVAEGKDPDEIAHDPKIRELLHQLRRCETEQKAQPLLE